MKKNNDYNPMDDVLSMFKDMLLNELKNDIKKDADNIKDGELRNAAQEFIKASEKVEKIFENKINNTNDSDQHKFVSVIEIFRLKIGDYTESIMKEAVDKAIKEDD